MIRICWDPGALRLSARGHAGAAPPGQDLLCAAVTALCASLARYAAAAGPAEIRLEPGDLWIRCPRPGRRRRELAAVFAATAGGLEALAAAHPAYLRFEKAGAEAPPAL